MPPPFPRFSVADGSNFDFPETVAKHNRAKLRALLSQEELLEKAMARLEKAANGKGLKEGESQVEVCARGGGGGRGVVLWNHLFFCGRGPQMLRVLLGMRICASTLG